MAGVVALRALFRGRAQGIRDTFGGALVVGREHDAHMAVVQYRVARPVGFFDLIQRLSDQVGAQAIAGDEGQGGLEKIQAAQRGEFVEHQEQLVPARDAVRAIQGFGQPPADLVKQQANQGLGAIDVRGRHHQVERHRVFGIDQVGNAPVAALRHRRHGRIAVQAQERHGGAQDPGALVLGLVQYLARGRCHHRVRPIVQMAHRHHRAQRGVERARRVRQKGRHAAQGLVRFGVQHVQDGAHQQRVRSLFPMVAPLQGPVRVHQDVGDVLGIAHFMRAPAHFQQRVIGGRARVGRIEQQAMREARAPASGELPVFALDVMHHARARPGQQRGYDQPHALARTGRGDCHDVFGAIMAQIGGGLARHLAENTPAGRSRPARSMSSARAQRADPKVVTRRAWRARATDSAIATPRGSTPALAAIMPPRANTSGA